MEPDVTGVIISSVVIAVLLGVVYGLVMASMYKKVVKDRWRKIDFQKSHIVFRWNRWDTIMMIIAGYTFLCVLGLFIFLMRGDTVNSPIVSFFLHQTFVLTIFTFCNFISRIAFLLKGIRERWPDDIE